MCGNRRIRCPADPDERRLRYDSPHMYRVVGIMPYYRDGKRYRLDLRGRVRDQTLLLADG